MKGTPQTGAPVELYACKGCGSAVIEAVLAWCDVPYTLHEVAWKPGAAMEEYARLNPLRQVPAMRMPDGAVLTESAAMILLIDEQHPATRILPPRGEPARGQALRWLLFMAGNLYPAISLCDFPERWTDGEQAKESLTAHSRERLQHYWNVMERELCPSPFLLGEAMTAVDIYAAMFSYWQPGRTWINEHCPRIAAALASTEQHPAVSAAWKRNFK